MYGVLDKFVTKFLRIFYSEFVSSSCPVKSKTVSWWAKEEIGRVPLKHLEGQAYVACVGGRSLAALNPLQLETIEYQTYGINLQL